MNRVVFIDTSVMCNLLPVPGRNQNEDMVKGQLAEMLDQGVKMILPITALIETGNFIAQLSSGHERRATAAKLSDVLSMICDGTAPWILHDVAWGSRFLADFLAGAGTGQSWIDHATAEIGAGDLCILTEREQYRARTAIQNVGLWTLDAGLSSFA